MRPAGDGDTSRRECIHALALFDDLADYRPSCVSEVDFLLLELLADRLQFLVAFRGRLGICHVESFERIEDDLGYDQPGVLLVVGGNDIPGHIACTCRAEAFPKRRHIVIPELPLLNVRKAEFPVLFRFVDAFEEPLSLLVL